MTDNITLPRVDALQIRKSLVWGGKLLAALTALDAALAEPEKERAEVAAPARNGVASSMEEIDILTPESYRTTEPPAKPEPYTLAELFAQFAAKQKPLDADMAAIINANLDSLYITDEPAAALAEPEPEPTVKESLTVDHIRSIWLDSWKACPNVPTPVLAEHFARQIERAHGIGLAKPTSKDSLQVASENEVEAMMPRPAPSLEFLDGFRDGWRAAERFHGITKGDKT
jgi:hypothetical protein